MDNIELGCAMRAMQYIAKNGFASWNIMVREENQQIEYKRFWA